MGTISQSSKHRTVVRIFVIAMIAAILVDVAPATLPLDTPKQLHRRFFGMIGLRQGEWPLFAPNPALQNGCIVADVFDREGNRVQWTSPIWPKTSSVERFYRFRDINYYNRIVLDNNFVGLVDLADYIGRVTPVDPNDPTYVPNTTNSGNSENSSGQSGAGMNLVQPAYEVRLYRYQKKVMIPGDEPLPKRSDLSWVSSSEPLVHRIIAHE